MLTYLNTKLDHVFTKEELLKELDKVIDSTENSIGPYQLSNLQKVRAGIIQMYTRIDQLNQAIDNLQKVINSYEAKINTLSQRVKQSREQREKLEKIDPVEKALRKIDGNVNM